MVSDIVEFTQKERNCGTCAKGHSVHRHHQGCQAGNVKGFIHGQSVVFVAIAFITMMIISLAWLIFLHYTALPIHGSQFGSQAKTTSATQLAF